MSSALDEAIKKKTFTMFSTEGSIVAICTQMNEPDQIQIISTAAVR